MPAFGYLPSILSVEIDTPSNDRRPVEAVIDFRESFEAMHQEAARLATRLVERARDSP